MSKDYAYEDLLNEFFARKPKDVDGVANASTAYYRDKLFRIILARFFIKNTPDKWDYDYLMYHTFGDGVITITDTSAGVLALKCGLTGIGIFDEPTQCIVANPVLGNFTRNIHEDCEILRINYNYRGVYPLINRYAVLLAMCDSGISVNLMNTKLTYVFGATDKGQANTFKKLYDKVTMGEPAVFTTKGNTAMLKESLFTMPAKQYYIADDIQITKRKIVNEFLTDIGINNANIDKRERLNTDEVNANNEELKCNIQHWIDNLEDGIRRVNAMFDLELELEVRDFDSAEIERSDLL